MEKELNRPYFNFLSGLILGVIKEVNLPLFFFLALIPFVILFGTSFNWKEEVKEILEDEKQYMQRDSKHWLVSLAALLLGLGTAHLVCDYFQL